MTRTLKIKRPSRRKPARLKKLIRIFLVFVSVSALLVCGRLGWDRVKSASYFRVARVDVLGAKYADAEELSYLSGLKPGMGMFDFKMSNVVKAVEYHPWVEKAQVSRQLPDRVVIRVWEETPAAILMLDEPYYMNEECHVFKKTVPGDSLDYPIITGIEYASLQSADPQLVAFVRGAIEIWKEAGDSRIYPSDRISEFRIEPSVGLVAYPEDGPIVRFGDAAFAERFRKLERMKVEIGGQFNLLRELDLSQPDRVVARFYKDEKAAQPEAAAADNTEGGAEAQGSNTDGAAEDTAPTQQ